MDASSEPQSSSGEPDGSADTSIDERPWWERMGPVEIWLAAGFLLWLSLMDFNQTSLSNSLDDSWQQALGYLLKHHVQAGTDYVFTYGPLGYFTTWAHDTDLYWWKYGWELFIKLAFALTFLTLFRCYRGRAIKIVAWLALILSVRLTTALPDILYVFTLLALSVLTLRGTWNRWAVLWLPAVLTIVTLIAFTKFTFLVFAFCAVLVVGVARWTSGKRWTAFLPMLGFLSFSLALWTVLGQAPAHFPKYVIGSLQIASGYNEGMARSGSKKELLLALGLAAGLAATLLTRRWRSRLNGTQIGSAVLISLALFLQFKHGFVRQDQHAFDYFGLVFLLPLLFPVAFPSYAWRFAPRAALLWTVFVVAGLGMVRNLKRNLIPHPDTVIDLATQSITHTAGNWDHVFHPSQEKERLDHVLAQREAEFELPRIKAEVGPETVDVVSFEQGALFRNHLNWHPRPVFQSYSAYTPYLLRANAEFFRGPEAPRYVLFKVQPVDGNLPTLEDGPTFLELLHRYRPVFVEKGYVLLKRMENGPAVATTTVRESVVHFDEEVPLDVTPGAPQKVTIHFEPSLLGRAIKFLYKPQGLTLRLRLADGQCQFYRLIPGMAEVGFLLNPLVTTSPEVIDLFAGLPGRKITAVAVQKNPHSPSCYRPEIHVKVENLPGLCRPEPASEMASLRYPSFQKYPLAVHSPCALQYGVCDGADGLIVQPEGTMIFAIPEGARHIAGRFGILPEAYTIGRTDGVQFSVEFRPDQGLPQVLFQRYLDPLTKTPDRGLKVFDVAIPPGAHGTIWLRTTNLPGKTAEWDWSMWSSIRIW